MDAFVQATRQSMAAKNWYASLFVALSMPDICGKLENPDQFSSERYKGWFDKYMAEHYTSRIGPDRREHVFLSAADCYALRCSFLHEGEDELGGQRCREVLERIHFVAPVQNMTIHCNQMNNVLQVQVDIFCEEICGGVIRWLEDVTGNPDVQQRIASLAKIYSPFDPVH